MRVGLFVTCLVDMAYPQVGHATAKLLRRVGVEPVMPTEAMCCGQMHLNSGYARLALQPLASTVRAVADCDVVVAPSASCIATLRHLLPETAARHGDRALAELTRDVAARSYELTEFLVDVLGVTDVGARFPHRVAYHPTCHSLRSLRVGDKPASLLRAVEDLILVDLDGDDGCCGFGGTFALKNAAISSEMLVDKRAAVVDSGAEVLTSVDTSCLMHIGGGLSRARSTVRTMHIAEILAST